MLHVPSTQNSSPISDHPRAISELRAIFRNMDEAYLISRTFISIQNPIYPNFISDSHEEKGKILKVMFSLEIEKDLIVMP